MGGFALRLAVKNHQFVPFLFQKPDELRMPRKVISTAACKAEAPLLSHFAFYDRDQISSSGR